MSGQIGHSDTEATPQTLIVEAYFRGAIGNPGTSSADTGETLQIASDHVLAGRGLALSTLKLT